MSRKTSESKLLQSLEDCTISLETVNAQITSLFDVIKTVKDDTDKERLLYTYKQSIEALRDYSSNFSNLIRAVGDEAEHLHEPKNQ